MKTLIKTIVIGIISSLLACGQTSNKINADKRSGDSYTSANVPDVPAMPVVNTQPGVSSKKKIKLAILLDTSNSMDGLIEQAKNQLWKIVTQLAKAKDSDGLDPDIELALYQYGNDNLSITNGYVQKISDFTTELDEISEKLFALRTRGGSEYCGTVIKASLAELEWSSNPDDLQLIFIAGNEPFTQGPVSYREICQVANSRNIIVNAIFCGNYNEGIRTSWKDGADLAKGKYMNIDHDAVVVHIPSPYDQQITQLNIKLNTTYIPYGKEGSVKKEKQLKEDANASSYGEANAVKRYISKGSKVYKNESWDLVDAADEADFKITDVPTEQLPEAMKGLSESEKIEYIKKYKDERTAIKNEMKELNKKREEYVTQKKAEQAQGGDQQLEDAMISTIVEQAKGKSFQFVDDIN